MSLKRRIKELINPVVVFLVSSKITWAMAALIVRMGNWLQYEKSRITAGKAVDSLNNTFADGKVRNGYFKGMKYPALLATGSSLYPKLFGSYEVELAPVLEKMEDNGYKRIIDIGCAEGYYAVGLAMKIPDATIYAFDIDKKALDLCALLAAENKVSNRIILREKCDPAALKELATEKVLIICDCEGYEETLFTAETLPHLKQADLIIELHPFNARNIREKLQKLFSHTHSIEWVSSYDNSRKLFEYRENEMGLQGEELFKCIEEGRPFTMDWLIARSLNQAQRNNICVCRDTEG